jgi:hypothetical protein
MTSHPVRARTSCRASGAADLGLADHRDRPPIWVSVAWVVATGTSVEGSTIGRARCRTTVERLHHDRPAGSW